MTIITITIAVPMWLQILHRYHHHHHHHHQQQQHHQSRLCKSVSMSTCVYISFSLCSHSRVYTRCRGPNHAPFNQSKITEMGYTISQHAHARLSVTITPLHCHPHPSLSPRVQRDCLQPDMGPHYSNVPVVEAEIVGSVPAGPTKKVCVC